MIRAFLRLIVLALFKSLRGHFSNLSCSRNHTHSCHSVIVIYPFSIIAIAIMPLVDWCSFSPSQIFLRKFLAGSSNGDRDQDCEMFVSLSTLWQARGIILWFFIGWFFLNGWLLRVGWEWWRKKPMLMADDKTSSVWYRLLSHQMTPIMKITWWSMLVITEDGGIMSKQGDDYPVFTFTAFSWQSRSTSFAPWRYFSRMVIYWDQFFYPIRLFQARRNLWHIEALQGDRMQRKYWLRASWSCYGGKNWSPMWWLQ